MSHMTHPFLGGLEGNSTTVPNGTPRETMDFLFGANKWKPNERRLVFLQLNNELLRVDAIDYSSKALAVGVIMGVGSLIGYFFGKRA